MMENAWVIFSLFSDILQKKKKPGCDMDDAGISAMCTKYASLCVLWDGAFSCISKESPSPADISQYQRYAKAAVYSHVAIGCSVTPKVHMIWKHVAT